MSQLSYRIHPIQNQLKPLLVGGIGPTKEELESISKPIPQLLLIALDDEMHLFAKQLAQLKILIAAHAALNDESPGLTPKHYFLPNPGVNSILGQYWPLQLLLCVAARSDQAKDLEDVLQMDVSKIQYYSERAYKFVSRFWGYKDWAHHLCQALELLDGEYSQPLVQLNGNQLACGDIAVKLSPTQAKLFGLLLASEGKVVTSEQLKEKGISRPEDTKHDLIKKFKKKGLASLLAIASAPGGYCFTRM